MKKPLKNLPQIASTLLILLAGLAFCLGAATGLDFLMDIGIALFVPFSILSGKTAATRSAAYGYLSLSLIVVFFLLVKKLYYW